MPDEIVVLDTNILIQDPTVLARSNPRVSLIVPSTVLSQLERFRRSDDRRSRLSELVRRAAHEKAIVIEPSEQLEPEADFRKIDVEDAKILSLAIRLASNHVNVKLATEDRDLQAEALRRGVAVLSLPVLREVLSRDPDADQPLLSDAKVVIRSQRWHLVASLILGSILTVLAQAIVTHIELVIRFLTNSGAILFFAVLGIALYWIRSRKRLTYGILEYLFGLGTVGYTVIADFSIPDNRVASIIKLVGAFYVMVRGLDNIGKGVVGTPFEVRWKKFFPGS